MKKSLVPLFFVLLLSCSSDDFDSEKAASAQKDVPCTIKVEDKDTCVRISKKLCLEIGGTTPCPIVNNPSGDSSSSDDDVSSSSEDVVSSSSVDDVSSSSSRNSSRSSSSNAVVSSSSADVVSSSSEDVISSSSSVDAVSSSSADAVSSSSSAVNQSSSSAGASSSSSSESLPPAWSECNIPPTVGRNEPIANLKFISIVNNNGRCSGTITYRLNSASSNATNLNYSSSAIGTTSTLNITASVTCSSGITLSPKTCSKQVTVADYVKFSEVSTDVFLKSGKTIVDIGGVPANMFGCQARDNSTNPSPNPFDGKTSFILDGKTVSVTDDRWWVKTAITGNRMLFESNNANVGSYRCQIE